MLARERDPTLGGDDRRLELGLLLGREEGESAAGPTVVVPGVGRADLVLVDDLGMDLGDILERLLNT